MDRSVKTVILGLFSVLENYFVKIFFKFVLTMDSSISRQYGIETFASIIVVECLDQFEHNRFFICFSIRSSFFLASYISLRFGKGPTLGEIVTVDLEEVREGEDERGVEDVDRLDAEEVELGLEVASAVMIELDRLGFLQDLPQLQPALDPLHVWGTGTDLRDDE